MGMAKDRISDLPEPLLLHILSFLPTKSVVSTCILSKRWRYMYTLTPFLDFHERKFYSFSRRNHALELENKTKRSADDYRFETEKFMNFVDKLVNDVSLPNIQKFSLILDFSFDSSRVIGWISTLLTKRKLQHLVLSFKCDFLLPSFCFTSQTLTKLELEHYIIRQLPESISFPSLKILKLKDVTFINQNMVERFLSNCQVLEELSLNKCIWTGREPIICISAPALKCLIVSNHDERGCDWVIKILAPNLVSFNYTDTIFKDHVLPLGFPSIVDADIDVKAALKSYDESLSACKLLASLCKAKLLKVSDGTLEVLSYVQQPLPKLPTFCNLIRLEVTSKFSCPRSFMDMLRMAPNLESLIFAQGFSQCVSVDHVLEPEFLLLNLKVVEFREFDGGQIELQAIEYFLNNGRALERITILSSSTLPTMEKNKVMKKLVKFPKISTNCVVNFY